MKKINIILNGTRLRVPSNSRLSDLTEYTNTDSNISNNSIIYVLNGYNTDKNSRLCENDSIVILNKHKMPSEYELEYMLSARNSPEVYEKIKNACIGIAGLGGLGSNIAIILARLGIGKLIIADFDIVEPTNLNRQHYFITQLGKFKTDASKELIKNINPYVKVECHTVRLDEINCVEIFKECNVICEAFDNPECKAWLTESILSRLPDTKLVASSGMAGFGKSNEIVTKKISDRFYICGDFKSEAKEFNGLMSPRVSICAGHQANMALRLIACDNAELK